MDTRGACLSLAVDAKDAYRAQPDSRPVGRRPWMGAVFGRAMDGESENGRLIHQVKLALIGEAPFLLVTFLWALAKKSNSPTAKALPSAAGKRPPSTALCQAAKRAQPFRAISGTPNSIDNA